MAKVYTSTSDTIRGARIARTLGYVEARNPVFGRQMDLIDRLCSDAAKMGANAVVSIRRTGPGGFLANDEVAYGTAVVIEPERR